MNKSTKISGIKELSQFLPFVGSYFILYGCIYAITYYNMFNVNIMSFLNFSEIVTFFLKDIYLVIFLLLFFLILKILVKVFESKYLPSTSDFFDEANKVSTGLSKNNVALSNLVDIKETDPEKYLEELKALEKNLGNMNSIMTESKKIKKSLSTGRKILIIAGIIVAVVFIVLITFIGNKFSFILSNISVLVLGVMINYFTKNINYMIVSMMLLLLLTFSFTSAQQNARKIKNTCSQIEYGLKKHSEHLDKCVVGKTKDFLFLYDQNDSSTTILPIENLEWLKIKTQ